MTFFGALFRDQTVRCGTAVPRHFEALADGLAVGIGFAVTVMVICARSRRLSELARMMPPW